MARVNMTRDAIATAAFGALAGLLTGLVAYVTTKRELVAVLALVVSYWGAVIYRELQNLQGLIWGGKQR